MRDFRRFYAGYATSLLGSLMSTVAIAWAVLGSGANATGLGYVFAAAVVPQVLLMAIAGAVADRFGRRRVMLTADALSIFPAYGVGVIGYAIDGPLAAFGPAAIFGVGAVYGLLSSAAVLTLRSVRQVTWADSGRDDP